jgi:hypothetical protein
MNKFTEDKTIQALAAVGSLAGLTLKKVSTGDDLKDYTLTLAFTGVSAGLVQERFEFDREDGPRLVATVNGHGEVMDLKKETDPSDLTEKDETLAQGADPDEGGALPAGDDSEKVGAAIGESREGIQAEQGTVVDLNSKKRR